MNGQPIISQADMQWVLHHIASDSELEVVVARDGAEARKTLALSGDWKRSNIVWRASFPSIRPHLWIRALDMSAEDKAALGLAPDARAMDVTTIWAGGVRRAGLEIGDIIVDADGDTSAMDDGEFKIWLKLNYKDGDKLPIVVLRDGKRVSLSIPIE